MRHITTLALKGQQTIIKQLLAEFLKRPVKIDGSSLIKRGSL